MFNIIYVSMIKRIVALFFFGTVFFTVVSCGAIEDAIEDAENTIEGVIEDVQDAFSIPDLVVEDATVDKSTLDPDEPFVLSAHS